ncbi:MAG: hypothetical protein SFU98_18750 [Leptospiraceae bacterium]|nr:hypothetical protein [Leptospiraceae bacterium]
MRLVLILLILLVNCNPIVRRNLLPLLGLTIGANNDTVLPSVVSIIPTTLDKTKALPVIDKNQKITITFNKDMDTSKCMTVSQNDIILSGNSTNWTNSKTAIISPPSSGWNISIFQEQKISLSDCSDPKGNLATNVTQSYLIADSLMHVSVSGNDSNSGSKESPKLTLSGGISGIGQCSTTCAVLVSAGNYFVTSNQIVPLNISLFGGYTTDWSDRNISSDESNYKTIVFDSRSIGGSSESTQISIFYFTEGAYSLEKTILEGFTLQSASTSSPVNNYSSAVYVNSSLATGVSIRFNKFVGGVGSSVLRTGYGVFTTNTSTTAIFGNIFTGGTGEGDFTCIRTENSTNTFISTNTIVNGNTNGNIFGINTNNSTTSLIQSNNISGGTTTSVGISAGLSIGGDSVVQYNSIIGPINTVSNSSGIRIVSGNSIVIDSNPLIKGGECTSTGCNSSGIRIAGTITNLVISKNSSIVGGTCSIVNCESQGIKFVTATVTNFQIQENSFQSGSAVSKSFGLEFSSGTISTLNIIDNTIATGAGDTSTGIEYANLMNATNFILTNNTIRVGSASSTSTGLNVNPLTLSALLIYRNTIQINGLSSSSNGLLLENLTSTTTFIASNLIISFLDSAFSLNTISGIVIGACNSTPNATLIYGNTIYLNSRTTIQEANIEIDGANCRPQIAYNLFRILVNTPTLPLCIKTSVLGTGDPLSLNKNSFQGCSLAYVQRSGLTHNQFCSGDFGQGGACGTTLTTAGISTSLNNIDAPVFTNVSSNDFTIQPSTPSSILNGIDATDISVFGTFNLDRNGNVRTIGSALGAYR